MKLAKAIVYIPLRLGFVFARLVFGRPVHVVYDKMSILEDFDVKCSCGLSAKIRVSKTARNPYRLFYNCPKSIDSQCGFFRWHDEPSLTGDKNTDELNVLRNECIQLQHNFEREQQEHENDRFAWDQEKLELTSQISNIQTELDDLKREIKAVNESELMPPVNKLWEVDDYDADEARVIQTV